MLASVASVALLGGCGERENEQTAVRPSCEEAWNAPQNEANREVVARSGGAEWRVEVSHWVGTPSSVEAPGEGMEGCAYVFFTATRWLGLSGAWEEDGSLLWHRGSEEGARTPGQRPFEATATVAADGAID